MGGYIVRRLLLAIPTLVGVSLLIFAMLHLVPGCPALAIAGPHATPDFVQHIREEFGLDKRIDVQYFTFIGRLFRGDLGISIRTRRSVATEIWTKLPNTVELAVASMAIASLIGIVTGIISATKRNSIYDNASMVVAMLGVSMPVFWLGLMLILLFSVMLGWLPVAGRGTMLHLILPAVTLGASMAAIIARMTRSSMLEVLQQDFITTARAKGLREQIVVYKHALKNALIPVITIIGLQFGTLLSGAILTETVFAWPGLGRLMVEAIAHRDFPVVQGAVLLFGTVFVFINLFVDILYSFLDPRIRYD